MGTVDAERLDGLSINLGRIAARRVLAHLAAVSPRSAPSPALIATAWTDQTMSAPGAALRMLISRLRRNLNSDIEESAIVSGLGGYRLSSEVDVDVRDFEERVALSRGSIPDHQCVRVLSGALRLWRGPPYEGFEGLIFESDGRRIQDLRLEAVDRYQRILIQMGRAREGLKYLRECREDNPLHEGLAALLVMTHYSLGERTTALREFEILRRSLREDLGLNPSPELRSLHSEILQQASITDVRVRPEPTGDSARRARLIVSVVTAAVSTELKPAGNLQHQGTDRLVTTLAQRAETCAMVGHWQTAADHYLEAIERALQTDDTDRAARLCMRLARITWDPELGDVVIRTLRKLLGRDPAPVLAAQMRICVAGGAFRTGAEAASFTSPAEFLSDLDTIAEAGTHAELAWALMRARDAMTGSLHPRDTLALSRRVERLSNADALIRGQNLRATFADLLRLGQRGAALRVARRIEDQTTHPEAAVDSFGRLTLRNCWNLAVGRFESVQRDLAASLEFRGRLSSATLDQVVLGQSYWLSRELGDIPNLESHLEGALAVAERDATTPLWSLAAAVLATDVGRPDQALELVRRCRRSFNLLAMSPGSHHTGLLSMTAEVLAVASLSGLEVDRELAEGLRHQLEADPNAGVLLGWPTVFMGAKERFTGFAALAAGDVPGARRHLLRARHEDRHMAPLARRSRQVLESI